MPTRLYISHALTKPPYWGFVNTQGRPRWNTFVVSKEVINELPHEISEIIPLLSEYTGTWEDTGIGFYYTLDPTQSTRDAIENIPIGRPSVDTLKILFKL